VVAEFGHQNALETMSPLAFTATLSMVKALAFTATIVSPLARSGRSDLLAGRASARLTVWR
jgi:hypothetical protein